MKYSLDTSNFLEKSSSLSHSIVFFCIVHLIRLSHLCSLELCLQLCISFPFSLAFASLLSSTNCQTSSDNHFSFLHLFFFGVVLVTGSCTMWKSLTKLFHSLLLCETNSRISVSYQFPLTPWGRFQFSKSGAHVIFTSQTPYRSSETSGI